MNNQNCNINNNASQTFNNQIQDDWKNYEWEDINTPQINYNNNLEVHEQYGKLLINSETKDNVSMMLFQDDKHTNIYDNNIHIDTIPGEQEQHCETTYHEIIKGDFQSHNQYQNIIKNSEINDLHTIGSNIDYGNTVPLNAYKYKKLMNDALTNIINDDIMNDLPIPNLITHHKNDRIPLDLTYSPDPIFLYNEVPNTIQEPFFKSNESPPVIVQDSKKTQNQDDQISKYDYSIENYSNTNCELIASPLAMTNKLVFTEDKKLIDSNKLGERVVNDREIQYEGAKISNKLDQRFENDGDRHNARDHGRHYDRQANVSYGPRRHLGSVIGPLDKREMLRGDSRYINSNHHLLSENEADNESYQSDASYYYYPPGPRGHPGYLTKSRTFHDQDKHVLLDTSTTSSYNRRRRSRYQRYFPDSRESSLAPAPDLQNRVYNRSIREGPANYNTDVEYDMYHRVKNSTTGINKNRNEHSRGRGRDYQYLDDKYYERKTCNDSEIVSNERYRHGRPLVYDKRWQEDVNNYTDVEISKNDFDKPGYRKPSYMLRRFDEDAPIRRAPIREDRESISSSSLWAKEGSLNYRDRHQNEDKADNFQNISTNQSPLKKPVSTANKSKGKLDKKQFPYNKIDDANNPNVSNFFPNFGNMSNLDPNFNLTAMTNMSMSMNQGGETNNSSPYWQQYQLMAQNYYSNYYKMMASNYPQAMNFYFPNGLNPMDNLNETLEEESETEDDSGEEELKVETTCQEPHFYTRPHTIARFCPNGKLIIYTPTLKYDEGLVSSLDNQELKEEEKLSSSEVPIEGRSKLLSLESGQTLKIIDIQAFFKDINGFKKFPGPLIKTETHKDDLIRYCTDLIPSFPSFLSSHINASRSESTSSSVNSSRHNIASSFNANDEKESQNLNACATNITSKISPNFRESFQLLVRYLCLSVSQNGAVVGADVSKLLISSLSDKISFEDLSQMNNLTLQDNSTITTLNFSNKFRELLLCGHQKEALEFAVKNSHWGHALFMALKIDKSLVNSIFNKFINTISAKDPILTFYQTIAGRESTYLNQIQLASFSKVNAFEWRSHLAMILANPTSNPIKDKKNVEVMGDVLGQIGDISASHLCYILAREKFGAYTDKIAKLVLLTSSNKLPFNKFLNVEAIRLTEIYEYIEQLLTPTKINCLEGFITPFQSYKFIYSTWLIDRGMISEAYRYIETISKAIVYQPQTYDALFIKMVYEIACRLKYTDANLCFTPDNLNTINQNENEFYYPSSPSWLFDLSNIFRPLWQKNHFHSFNNLTQSEEGKLANNINAQISNIHKSNVNIENSGFQLRKMFESNNATLGGQEIVKEESRKENNALPQISLFNINTNKPTFYDNRNIVSEPPNVEISQASIPNYFHPKENTNFAPLNTKPLTNNLSYFPNSSISFPIQQNTFNPTQFNPSSQPNKIKTINTISITPDSDPRLYYQQNNQKRENFHIDSAYSNPDHYKADAINFGRSEPGNIVRPLGSFGSLSSIQNLNLPITTFPQFNQPLLKQQNYNSQNFIFDNKSQGINNMGEPYLTHFIADNKTPSISTKEENIHSEEPTSKKVTKEVNSASKGWFGGIINKILPKGPNEMILPDDSKKTILWNEDKKRWENSDGTAPEDDMVPPPPSDDQLFMYSTATSPVYPFNQNLQFLPGPVNEIVSPNQNSNFLTGPNSNASFNQYIPAFPFANNFQTAPGIGSMMVGNKRSVRSPYVDVFAKAQNQSSSSSMISP
ncbi:unnamed protein product [Gordionus sp. m RMFG-2023]